MDSLKNDRTIIQEVPLKYNEQPSSAVQSCTVYSICCDKSILSQRLGLAVLELARVDQALDLAGELNGLTVADEIKGVWAGEVKRLVDAGKLKDGEAKTLA